MLSDEQVRTEVWQSAMQADKHLPSYMAAFLLLGGSLGLGARPSLSLSFRQYQSGLLASRLLKDMYGFHADLTIESAPGRKTRTFSLDVPAGITDRLLVDCHMKHDKDGQPLYTLSLGSMRWVNAAAFLAALYLDSGVLYAHDEYRLDLALSPDTKRLSELEAMLGKLEIKFLYKLTGERLRISFRKEDISSFLALIGAPESSLAVTQFYFERNVNASLNRAVNCTTNNMDKQYEAASHQTLAIEYLKQHGLYNALSAPLKQVAEARLTNPEASLAELAVILGITKVTVHRRLQKIIEFFQQKGGK